MPRLSTATAVSAETEITVKPSVRRRLLLEFKKYQKLKTTLDETQAEMDAIKDSIQALREQTGEKGLLVEGYRTKLVEPTRKIVNWKKIYADGVMTTAQRTNYTDNKPTKAYEKITLPGEKEDAPQEDE